MATSVSEELLCEDPTSYWTSGHISKNDRISNTLKAVYTKRAEGSITAAYTEESWVALWRQHLRREPEACRGLPCAILVHDQPDVVGMVGHDNPREPAFYSSPPTTRLETDVASTIDHDQIEAKFGLLADWWREETGLFSFDHQMERHPAYAQILEMGETAIPLILKELQERPYRWFGVLQALTGENPVSSEGAGDFDHMSSAWKEWGKTKGY